MFENTTKKRTTDMTVGSPIRHLILFSIPALIGNIFQQVYNLADSIIVGKFCGANALAAVGATFSITFFFFALCNGISSGGGIIVSQFYGAHEEGNVKRAIVNTGFIMLIVPLIFGTTGFITAPYILRLLSTPDEIMADSTMYIRFMCVGLLFTSIYNFISNVLRALGDSKTPLYFLILSTIINVIFDVIFVYSFEMGIQGAALATIIAQFISALTSGIYAYVTNPVFKIEKKYFVISSKILKKIIKLGVPMSLQFAMIAVSSMAVQRIVNSYGTTVVAAFTATNRIEQFIHMPYTTLGASLSTYCGQNYGAKKYDRVLTGYKKGLVIMSGITIFMLLVMQLFGGTITSLFVSDPEVIALGKTGLQITSLFYFLLGLIYVVRGVLTGTGDAFFALFNGIVEVIGRFTIPIFMTSYLGMGARGIWISAGVVWAISGITAWFRYYYHFQKKYFPRQVSHIEPVHASASHK
ncbi:MAG: MATE family efflux transporter [Eubacterium sp.]|nr:MATE family efflux transporter [Eubacterium sp.]